MNQWIIIGNVVHDPETGTTQAGVNWSRFKVAVRKKYKREGQPDADFIRVTAWRALGDTCAKFLKKGRKVCVTGIPGASGWIGSDGQAKVQLEMTADDVEFIGGSGGAGQPSDADAPPEGPAEQEHQTEITEAETDEQPF